MVYSFLVSKWSWWCWHKDCTYITIALFFLFLFSKMAEISRSESHWQTVFYCKYDPKDKCSRHEAPGLSLSSAHRASLSETKSALLCGPLPSPGVSFIERIFWVLRCLQEGSAKFFFQFGFVTNLRIFLSKVTSPTPPPWPQTLVFELFPSHYIVQHNCMATVDILSNCMFTL